MLRHYHYHLTSNTTMNKNLDRHHSWENGTRDADLPAVVDKLEEHIHLKEELCDDEVCTSINLLLEML